MRKHSHFEDATVAKEVTLTLQGYKKSWRTFRPLMDPLRGKWLWRGSGFAFSKLVKEMGFVDPTDTVHLGEHIGCPSSWIFNHPALIIKVITWINLDDRRAFYTMSTENPFHVFILLSTNRISEGDVDALLSTMPWTHESSS